jgi:hypothetical protein
MNNFFNNLLAALLLLIWIAGIVIAKGFWSTLFAFFPFYAFYLFIEKVLITINLI